MAIAEHVSTPAVKTQTGTGITVTSDAFSPPANSLIVVLFGVGKGNVGSFDVLISDSTAGGLPWIEYVSETGSGSNKGFVAIYRAWVATAPGSMTVTVETPTGVSGRMLAPRVVTGVDNSPSFFGSAIQRYTASTTGTVSITTRVPGSSVYGISDDPDNAATYTANGSTTIISSFNDTTDSIRLAVWRSTSLTSTTPGAIALGGTWGTANSSTIIALEIPPPSGSVSFTANATLTAGATRVKAGTATLAAVAVLTTDATRVKVATAILSATATLTSGGTRVIPATATLSATATLTAGGFLAQFATATMAAGSGLTAEAFLGAQSSVAMVATSSVAAEGTRVRLATATMTAGSTFVAAGVPGVSVVLAADSTLASTATQTVASVALMVGLSTFTGPAWMSVRVGAAMVATSELVTAAPIPLGATLPATSTLTTTAFLGTGSAALMAATSTLVTTLRIGVAASATLSATATFTVSGPFQVVGGIGVILIAAATFTATAVVVPPPTGTIPTVTFWALNPNGTYAAPLPDVVSWQLSPVTGSPGAVTLDYPAAGRNFDVLRASVTQDRDLEVAIWITGQDTGSLRALLNTSDGDDVAESAVWRFSGNFLNVRMEEAFVSPRTTVVTPPIGSRPTEDLAALRVYAVTAGTLMATLMQEAQARGALLDITRHFTSTADSRGRPWSKMITLKIAPGTDYLAVLTSLVEAQMCEWEVVEHELVLWEYGTRGTDHTLTTPPLVLHAGDTITDSPRKHTVRDAGTTLLVAGGDGLYQEVSDATALARRGRRIEKYVSQGSFTQSSSLAAYAAAKLPVITTGTMEVAHGVALTPNGPRPLIDYQVGDWIWSDTGHGLERLRIAQLTVTGDQSGMVSAGVSLNDLIADQLEQLSRRISGIEGGTTVTGTTNAQPVGTDTTTPGPPQGVAVTSLAQPGPQSVPRSAVFAEWAGPIVNDDATVLDDLAGYVVQWRYLDPGLTDNWIQLADVDTEETDWGDVIAGEPIEVRVLAFDTTGNRSVWSTSAFHTTETDGTPPPTPSTPVVTEFLGTLTVTWNGLGSAGEPMPADFAAVEIHRSLVSGFIPSPATLVERMVGAGARNYPDLPFEVTQFFRLVAYDRVGNYSGPSAQGSGVPAPVGYGDIAFKQVGNLVQDGSFETVTSRALHLSRSDTGWSFLTGGAEHADWFARGSGAIGSGTRRLVLSPQIPAVAGQQFAFRFALRGISPNGDISARIRWYLSDDTTTDTVLAYTPASATGSWTPKEVSPYTAPALVESMDVRFEMAANCTSGSWDIDRVELREMIGTLLVQDAAITNAKILNLSVGKLTAGTITAVMLMAGLLRSATSGLRYEMDDDGLRFYDNFDNVVINLDVASASAMLTGTVQTGRSGRRVVLSGVDSDIKFFPQAGESRYGRIFSYIPGNFPNDIAVEIRSIDSDSTDYTSRHWMLPDSQSISVVPQGNGGDLISKSYVKIGIDGVHAGYHNIIGSPPYTAANETVRARLSIIEGGVFAECRNGNDRDGGFLWLGRGVNSAVFFGLKTSTVDNFVHIAQLEIQFYIQGSRKMEISNNGVFATQYHGYGSGFRANLKSDAGNEIFFYWGEGQLNIGTGGSFVKTFVIDHPARPDRFLVHGTTESPHAGVEYWGEATVEDGEVEVTLPGYFEALTRQRGRNVQVTVLAEDDPKDRKSLTRRKPRKRWDPVVTPGAPPSRLPPVPVGLPPQVQATYPRDGKFTIYALGPVDTFRVMWLVKAIRRDVPQLDVEPLKTAGRVVGDGPYTYYVPDRESL